MNKTELIETLASKTESSKASVARVLDAFTETVSEELTKGNSVQLVGFGSFVTSNRAARTAKNPRTGDPVKVEAKTVAKFKPGSKLAEAVNSSKKKSKKK